MPRVQGDLFLLSHLIFAVLQDLLSLRTILYCFPVAGKQNFTPHGSLFDLIDNKQTL